MCYFQIRENKTSKSYFNLCLARALANKTLLSNNASNLKGREWGRNVDFVKKVDFCERVSLLRLQKKKFETVIFFCQVNYKPSLKVYIYHLTLVWYLTISLKRTHQVSE